MYFSFLVTVRIKNAYNVLMNMPDQYIKGIKSKKCKGNITLKTIKNEDFYQLSQSEEENDITYALESYKPESFDNLINKIC